MAEESAPEEATDIRRKAATRLGIAAAVTAVALAGLWWLDQSGKATPKPAAPSPIVSAPAATPPAPPVEVAEPAPAPGDGRQPPAEEAPATPPPPPRPELTLPPAAKPAASTARAPRPAAVPAPPAVAPAQGNGDFVVQLGVFSNPANAQELVERLKKRGIRAYSETRVQVGPFKDKAEAEKAQAELKRMGLNGLVGTTK